MDDSAIPFMRAGPETPRSPVVLSVPHAGRAYSSALLGAARLSRDKLEILEDRLVDRLVWRAVAAGATALIARAPRAEIDLNRDEREIDPCMVVPAPLPASLIQSARTRGGLGLVPARIGGFGQIWRQRLPAAELRRRLEDIHRPFHRALEETLEAARNRFGIAILLDCHSMPSRPGTDAAIIFGDRHGTSIASDLFETAIAAAAGQGFAVARNTPYAGGHVTERHGKPAEDIHALQLEVDRSLYLAADLRSPGDGFDKVSLLIAAIAAALSAKALECPQAIAAE